MNISINNKNWGLYIGVENIDESFLTREKNIEIFEKELALICMGILKK